MRCVACNKIIADLFNDADLCSACQRAVEADLEGIVLIDIEVPIGVYEDWEFAEGEDDDESGNF
jgi:hypothetical protein